MMNYSLNIVCRFVTIDDVVINVVFIQDCHHSFSHSRFKSLCESFDLYTNCMKFEAFTETEFQMKLFHDNVSKTKFNEYELIKCSIDNFINVINK